METCKIYNFTNFSECSKREVENKIDEMLKKGWKCKMLSTNVAGQSNGMTIVVAVFEKPEDKTVQKNID